MNGSPGWMLVAILVIFSGLRLAALAQLGAATPQPRSMARLRDAARQPYVWQRSRLDAERAWLAAQTPAPRQP